MPQPLLPCNTVCNLPPDWETLGRYTRDWPPSLLDGQHPIRAWEYAMTARTIDLWQETQATRDALQIADIGGAGSRFSVALQAFTVAPVLRIDPAIDFGQPPGSHLFRGSVEEYVRTTPRAQGTFDVLTVVSVIEHVDDLVPFFTACRTLLTPGGLLVGTTDFWDSGPGDTAHFHWMRHRIYHPAAMTELLTSLERLGYKPFGSADWSYHGPQVYDYSVCAFALTAV